MKIIRLRAVLARRSAIPNCRRNPGMQDCADQLIGVSHPAQLKCFAWGGRGDREITAILAEGPIQPATNAVEGFDLGGRDCRA